MVRSSSHRTTGRRDYEIPQKDGDDSDYDKQVAPRGSRFYQSSTSSSMVSRGGRSRGRVTCCAHGKPCSRGQKPAKKYHRSGRGEINALTTAVSLKKSVPAVSASSDTDVEEYMGYENFHSLNNRKALLPGDDEYEYEPINPMPNKSAAASPDDNDDFMYNYSKPARESLLNLPNSKTSAAYLQSLARRRKEKKRVTDTEYEVVERLPDYAEQPPSFESRPSSGRRRGSMPPHRRVSRVELINTRSADEGEDGVSSGDGSRSTRRSTDYYLNWYLGERTRAQAERMCRKRVSFLLYHRYPSFRRGKTYEHVPLILPLFIVYRASNGKYFHYRVINRSTTEWPTAVRVDIPGEPYFYRLSALIYYYSTYSIAHGGNEGVDCFAWWKTDKRRPLATIYDEPTARELSPVMALRKKRRDI